jgi:iron complex outermembrane receptor protein
MSQILGLAAMIINAPEATVKGLEFETLWAVNGAWTINANLSLLKSTYGEFSNTDSLNPAAGIQDLKGNYLNYSPKASGNLGVQYAQDVALGRITARADLYLTSKFYFREFNGPLDGQDSYGRLNLALIWDSPDERYRIRGYATNVTGEDYLSTMGTSDNFGARFVNWAPPRQYGVELSARF